MAHKHSSDQTFDEFLGFWLGVVTVFLFILSLFSCIIGIWTVNPTTADNWNSTGGIFFAFGLISALIWTARWIFKK